MPVEVHDPHVPEIQTADGLLDIIAVGCILEFASALTRDIYSGKQDETNEETITRMSQLCTHGLAFASS